MNLIRVQKYDDKWNNYNDAHNANKAYRQRYWFYPLVVMSDKSDPSTPFLLHTINASESKGASFYIIRLSGERLACLIFPR